MPGAGAPGFNGARLREAREARGLTGVSLAELLNVSRQVVSQYELGQAAPSVERLFTIAGRLNVPIHYFLRGERPAAERTVFFRRQAAATRAEQTKSERRLEWLEDLVRFIEEYVALPVVDVPDVLSLRGRTGWTASGIEDAASSVRAQWGMGVGPIENVVNVLEQRGFAITRGVTETERIDAFGVLLEPSRRPAVFLGNDKDSAARSRFDAAHELGHHILHRDVGPRQLMTGTVRKVIEDEAHRFASAFLMPAREFLQDLRSPTLQSMQLVKPRWGASIGAMIQRCIDLEVLDAREAARLWVIRSKRGWARSEPLDDVQAIEQPTMLAKAIEVIVNEAGVQPTEIVRHVHLTESDLEALAGLPEGYLSAGSPPVQLVPRARQIDAAAGDVIAFRPKANE